jgi:hypothetical protein
MPESSHRRFPGTVIGMEIASSRVDAKEHRLA